MDKPAYKIDGDKVINDKGEVVFTEDINEDVRWRETAQQHKEHLEYLDSYIDITGVDLRTFLKEVYNLSRPQGMGYLHHKEDPLSDEDIDQILSQQNKARPLSLDYVRGRACKMNIITRGDRWFIAPNWHDHSELQLQELLMRCDIVPPTMSAA